MPNPTQLRWWDQPLHRRAAPGGEAGLDGKVRRGGQFLPFYVPREIMPQIDEVHLPALVKFALDRDVSVAFQAVDAHALRAHQRINLTHALSMPPEVLFKPLLVSSDGYVLDGNHRWWAHVHTDLAVAPTIRIGLPFEAAVGLLFEFPETYAYGDGHAHPIAN